MSINKDTQAASMRRATILTASRVLDPGEDLIRFQGVGLTLTLPDINDPSIFARPISRYDWSIQTGADSGTLKAPAGNPLNGTVGAALTIPPYSRALVTWVDPTIGYLAAITSLSASAQAFTTTDVYIDASNGNDANDGSVAHPWKTNARFREAVGLYGLIAPANAGQLCRIHYVGPTTPPSSDPFTLQAILAQGAILQRDFSAITGQVTHAGGTVTAVRAINQATSVSAAFTDAAIPDWTPFVGQRVRITSGANLGVIAFVLVRETATRAEVSPPTLISGVGAGLFGLLRYPAPGDSYVIEQMPDDWRGAIDLLSIGGDQNFQTAFQTYGAVARNVDGLPGETTRSMVQVYDVSCSFPNGETVYNDIPIKTNFACLHQGLLSVSGRACQAFFCAFLGPAAGILATNLATVYLDDDTIAEGSLGYVAGSNAQIIVGDACAFRTVVGFLNPSGDGFVALEGVTAVGIGPGIIHQVDPSGAVYGTANTGVGWRLARGNTSTTTVRPVVTGVGGDFALGTFTTASKYNPATGAYVVPELACTWANMNVAANLNGTAHQPANDCHLLTVAGA